MLFFFDFDDFFGDLGDALVRSGDGDGEGDGDGDGDDSLPLRLLERDRRDEPRAERGAFHFDLDAFGTGLVAPVVVLATAAEVDAE